MIKKDLNYYNNGNNNNNNDQKGRIIEILVEIDRIHRENEGKLTVKEVKLRVIVRINLSVWNVFTKIKTLRKYLSRLLKIN